jgi:hypothetical protein
MALRLQQAAMNSSSLRRNQQSALCVPGQQHLRVFCWCQAVSCKTSALAKLVWVLLLLHLLRTCVYHLLCQLCVVSCNVPQAPYGCLLDPWVKLLKACHQAVQCTAVNHCLSQLWRVLGHCTQAIACSLLVEAVLLCQRVHLQVHEHHQWLAAQPCIPV